jgi:hypothetical protein
LRREHSAAVPSWSSLELAADPDLTVVTYSAEPASRSEEGLVLLRAVWRLTKRRRRAKLDQPRLQLDPRSGGVPPAPARKLMPARNVRDLFGIWGV